MPTRKDSKTFNYQLSAKKLSSKMKARIKKCFRFSVFTVEGEGRASGDEKRKYLEVGNDKTIL